MSKVEFVRQGPFLLVQFNTTCDDALPTCDAMCCRMRPYFNVQINDDEKFKYITRIHNGVRVLDFIDGDCIYLDEDKARCSIYDRRPRKCREWHCSPKGNADDPQITVRENGWLLVVGSNEVLKELK